MTRRNHVTSWGTVAALLAGCFATLVGVVCGVEPHVIVMRASASALGIGAIVAVCSAWLSRSIRSRVPQRRRG